MAQPIDYVHTFLKPSPGPNRIVLTVDRNAQFFLRSSVPLPLPDNIQVDYATAIEAAVAYAERHGMTVHIVRE